MRFIVLFLFIFLPFFAVGQSVDTAAVNQQVDSLLKISNSLIEKGEFDKALEVNFVAEQFTLEKLGRGSMAYGNVCLKKGVIFYNQGNYPEAERWYLETKSIFEKKLGKWHRAYAAIVNNLGNLYFAEGNYQKAEKFYLETLAIDEKAVGKEHPNYAGSLLNIGTIYYSTSNYEKAEPYFLDAKKIWERSLGREHPRYVTALSNLGVLYMQWGDYLKAEPLFLEARDILKKITGEEHHYYAKVLSNLGNLYRAVGNYEKAVSCFLETKNTREQVLGKEHPEYALALSKLGVSYSLLGNYEKAEPLLLEARGLTAKALGPEAPQYSLILIYLGVFYLNYGDLEKASLILLEAKDLVEQNLGKGHDLYSNILVNLGTLNQRTGNYEQAESFFSEAETSWKEVIGEDDTYVKILKAQANLYWAIGKFEKVGPLYWEANEAEQKFLINASLHLSETELSSYIKTFNLSQNQIFSFSQLLQLGGSGLYDNTLFKKGFLLNSTNRINRLALSDSTSTELYYNHKSHLRRLAAEYAKPMAERQNVKELEAKAEELEKELVRTVAGYGEAIRQVSWQEVQVALQPGEAAVEFVHYTYSGPEPTDSVMYAALVLRPGDEAPHFIPLFEERQLQAQLQENLSDRKAYLNELYGHRKKKADSPSLYRLIWHPLEKLLANVETVYASPSGLLHRINLGAVMVDKRKTWGNKHQLVLLGSTRQLVVGNQSTLPAPHCHPLRRHPLRYGQHRYPSGQSGRAAHCFHRRRVFF